MKLPLSRIQEFLAVAPQAGIPADAVATGYSIDSRTVRPGELFFAVKGEKLDGHDFVKPALEKGAVAAVVAESHVAGLRSSIGDRLLLVPDTLLALQSLATAVRRLWGRTLVGVTGSTGKTTTKEAIAHVLSSRLHVHKSEGNLNNHFGLPLMLLKLEPEHEIAVIEMGMSHAGEIAALGKIAQPDIGVITNVAPVHLEFFDSIAGIARAKYELIESLPTNGIAILNADDEYVSQFARNFHGKVITYGLSPAAGVRAINIEARGYEGSRFDAVISSAHQGVKLPLIGEHNVYNALAAISVGVEAGLSLQQAAAALSSLSPADKRGEVVQLGNITVVNDCYNSNPTALRAMTDALARMPAKRRIVVAGEMLELGPESRNLHRACGQYIAGRKIDLLLGVRGLAEEMVEAAKESGMKSEFVHTPEEAADWLAREAHDGDVVLMKASRGVKLEKALQAWKAIVDRFGTRERGQPSTLA